MKVVCAWCEKEGKPALIGERAPFFDRRATHGICPFHAFHYRARLRAGLRKVQPLEGQMRAEPVTALLS